MRASTGSPGRFDVLVFESRVLLGNPLGDSHRRPLWVYLPPGYEDEPGRRYPSVYILQGLFAQLEMWRNRQAFRLNYPELVEQLFARGDAPPCIVVWVDCWTSYGGSQFLDSPATGRYHTYLCDEVVPWVDAHYRTLAGPAHRGIQGKSSGGFGAMVTCMLRPDLFGGMASHAGDALFEISYLPAFGPCVKTLRDSYGGSFDRFWADFRSRPAMARDGDLDLLNLWAMSACYSAEPDGSFRFPIDLHTGRLVPEVWERWLYWDPVRMVARHVEAVRSLKAIYIDAGRHDEFQLDLAAEAFGRALAEVGACEVRLELFAGRHGGIEYRYPVALRYLAERLSPGTVRAD